MSESVPTDIGGSNKTGSRGGVNSERHFNPRGNRPRPTGQDTNLAPPGVDPLRNRLLAKLPRTDFDQLESHFVHEQLPQGVILAEANDEIDQVYFPISGMISLVIVMQDGKAIETGTVGRDNMFGAAAGFGLHKSRVRAVIQVKMDVDSHFGAAFPQGRVTQ